MNTENAVNTLKLQYRLYDETVSSLISINEVGPNATVEKVLNTVGLDWFDFPNYTIQLRPSGSSSGTYRRVTPVAAVRPGDEILFLPN